MRKANTQPKWDVCVCVDFPKGYDGEEEREFSREIYGEERRMCETNQNPFHLPGFISKI